MCSLPGVLYFESMVEQNSTNASDSTTRASRLHVIIIFNNRSSLNTAFLDSCGQRVERRLRSVGKSPALVVHGLRVVREAELECLLAGSITFRCFSLSSQSSNFAGWLDFKCVLRFVVFFPDIRRLQITPLLST